MPVLFWFHGSGGNAKDCGQQTDKIGESLAEYSVQNNFVLVCGEARQFEGEGGQWDIPVVLNDKTGNKCDPKEAEASDIAYLYNMFNFILMSS